MSIVDIDVSKIQYTLMSLDDLILSLDRLTRFKSPEGRYFRVYSDIICKHLLVPKISKQKLECIDNTLVKSIVEKIWNDSVEFICKKNDSFPDRNKKINSVLYNDTLNIYNVNDDVKELVSLNLSITPLLRYIKDLAQIPINLKRLLYISEEYNAEKERMIHSLLFPVDKVVLCEGITEEILLPCFSKLYGYNFDKFGVKLISAGGKNQVAKLYVQLKEELKIPVFILLDADATEIASLLEPSLRDIDKLYLIKHGEFEDIFSLNLIKRTINKRFKNICECTVSDFHKTEPMTRILNEFYRVNELGDFQKADFAKEIADNLKYKTDLTEELIEIIEQIKELSI